MCDCVETINEKLAEAGLNTRIKVPMLLSNDLKVGAKKLQVVTEKADVSVRKHPVSVFTSFCPFCGEKQDQGAES